VVDDFSSKTGLGKPFEVVETIDTNHFQMARCSTKGDQQYRAILAVLTQSVCTGLDANTKAMKEPYAAVMAASDGKATLSNKVKHLPAIQPPCDPL
jgi:hypothetical protein